MYKVFIYDKPVFISKKAQFQGSFEQFDGSVSVDSLIIKMKEDYTEGAEIIVDDVESYFSHFKKAFKFIIAAGGAVFNKNEELLVIYRLGMWDLPKGKLEKGEDIPTCAVREVEEECNVGDLQIQSELESTYHCYFHKGKWVLKRTYWYYMTTSFEGKLIPQEEEGIEKVEWLPRSEWDKITMNTYNSLKAVVEAL